MLRLDKVIKPWKESGALNDHINLYGFWNETTFLTKGGDVGMVLSVPGVDYESLDRSEQEYAVKRLEAALKAFGLGFHVYQYLFKSNCPDIPFAEYDDPVVAAAIDQRRKFFDAKRDHLYEVEIFYCILLEGSRSKTGVGAALTRFLHDPAGAIEELRTQFTNNGMKTLLRAHIERDVRRVEQQVQAFSRQLADFMQIEILNQEAQFTFFRRLLNYDDWRVAGKPQSTQFLDYQVVNSDIEAERDHLRVGDHFVRVLTMKEAITETRPLVLDALLKIPANFYVVTYSLVFFAVQFMLALLAAIVSAILAYGAIAATIIGLLGPIFIPFLVFDKLDWLFWSWLKAYLGFSFYKVVAAATMNVLSHVLTNYYLQLGQSVSDPSLMVQTLPLLVLLVLVNIYILFKIPTMTHSLFTGGTGGHGGGLGAAMMVIRAAM